LLRKAPRVCSFFIQTYVGLSQGLLECNHFDNVRIRFERRAAPVFEGLLLSKPHPEPLGSPSKVNSISANPKLFFPYFPGV
jgi:hypothetical protein